MVAQRHCIWLALYCKHLILVLCVKQCIISEIKGYFLSVEATQIKQIDPLVVQKKVLEWNLVPKGFRSGVFVAVWRDVALNNLFPSYLFCNLFIKHLVPCFQWKGSSGRKWNQKASWRKIREIKSTKDKGKSLSKVIVTLLERYFRWTSALPTEGNVVFVFM